MEILLGVKVVKTSTPKTDTHGKKRESKESKFQGKNRDTSDTSEIISWESKSSKYQPQKQTHLKKSRGSQRNQNSKGKTDTSGNLVRRQSDQNSNAKTETQVEFQLGVKIVNILTQKQTHLRKC